MGATYRTKQILIMVFALILALVVANVRVKNELQIQRAREARRLAE
jgi:Na+-translocating ferredoxin:NAD+ oxidoreductase RnfG subunit